MPNNRQVVNADNAFAATCFIAVATLFGLVLLADAVFFRIATYIPTSDYWQYTAALTEWMNNIAAPGNPHLAIEVGSPLYMPWFWLLSSLGAFFGSDAVTLMSMGAVINYLLIIFGLAGFLRLYFRDAWAPLIGFVVLFLFWGVPLIWPNIYQFRTFLYIAAYPATFVFGLSLIAFWSVLRILRSGSAVLTMSVLLLLLTPLMLLSDPLTSVFGLGGCALLALTEAADSPSRRGVVFVMLLAGALLAGFWPYFSFWDYVWLLLSSDSSRWLLADNTIGGLERFNTAGWHVLVDNPLLLLTMLGPGVVAIPAWFWLALRRQYAFIVYGALLAAMLLLVGLYLDLLQAHKLLLFVFVYFQFALVWAILQVIDAWRTLPRPPLASFTMWATAALMAGAVLLNVMLLITEFRGYSISTTGVQLIDRESQLPGEISVAEFYARLAKSLPETSVVLTGAQIGWPLPTFQGKVVAPFQDNPLVSDQGKRYQAAISFFFKPIGDQRRSDIIRQYKVTHILLRSSAGERKPFVTAWMNSHATLMDEFEGYGIFSVIQSTLEPVSLPPTSDMTEIAESVDTPLEAARVKPELIDAGGVTNEREQTADKRKPIAKEHVRDEQQKTNNFGTPIAEPLIQPSETEMDGSLIILEEQRAVQISVAKPGSSASGQLSDDVPNAEVKSQPDSYGAPIPEPMLDPELHGG